MEHLPTITTQHLEQLLGSATADGFWLWNVSGDEFRLSRQLKQFLGFSEDEIAHRFDAWVDQLHPDDKHDVLIMLQRNLLDPHSGRGMEFRLRCKNGDYKWINARSLSFDFTEFGGSLFLVFLHVDISEYKHNEEVLKVSEHRFRDIVDSTDGIVWEADVSTLNFTFVSEKAERLLGYPVEEWLTPNFWVDHIHPEDQTWAPQYCLAYTLRLEQHDFEYRFIAKSGETVWLRDIVNVVAENGQPRWLRGVMIDITKAKLAEEELRFAALVFQNSDQGMLVSDANNCIIAVNHAFTQITGYKLDEVKGKNPSMLSSGRHDKAFYREMWQSIQAAGSWHGEIWNRSKSGVELPVNLTIHTIKNDDGSVHRHVAMFSDKTEQKRFEELLWDRANIDSLTRLPNRQLLHYQLDQETRKTQETGHGFSLVLFDIDHFREVNDTLGHKTGDLLLVQATSRIRESLSESDTLARLGGDEFIIIHPGMGGIDVEELIQRILERLSDPFNLNGEEIFISASVGVTVCPIDSLDADQLLKNAEQAMYEAKKSGKNRHRYFTKSLQDAAQSRLRLIGDMRQALDRDQFKVYFQPIVNLSSGRIEKAEALLRWHHPERGVVSPMEFIPLAEETGLIIAIGDMVFRKSARWAKRWENYCSNGIQISVNKSPVQFQASKDTHDDWIKYLKELHLREKSIVVEVTEGLLLDPSNTTVNLLLQMQKAGVQIAIDDFGTGYSSLSYLKKFHIDYLKIDRSFIRDIPEDVHDMALSEAIVVMAHKLGLKVIAEGVETNEQKNFLQSIGCDYGQGYLFSEAIAPEAFEALLIKDAVYSTFDPG